MVFHLGVRLKVAEQSRNVSHFSSDSHKEAIWSYTYFCDPLCHIDIMLNRSTQNAEIKEEAHKLEDLGAVMVLMDVAKILAH